MTKIEIKKKIALIADNLCNLLDTVIELRDNSHDKADLRFVTKQLEVALAALESIENRLDSRD